MFDIKKHERQYLSSARGASVRRNGHTTSVGDAAKRIVDELRRETIARFRSLSTPLNRGSKVKDQKSQNGEMADQKSLQFDTKGEREKWEEQWQ